MSQTLFNDSDTYFSYLFVNFWTILFNAANLPREFHLFLYSAVGRFVKSVFQINKLNWMQCFYFVQNFLKQVSINACRKN